MGRFLTVPFFLLALVLAAIGCAAAAFHLRARQALLDQALFQSWQRLGSGLSTALRHLDQPADTSLDPQRLATVVSDTSIQAHLGALGDRVDSLCREVGRNGKSRPDLDSLRESLRRDRQNLGLAVANYRGERRSVLGTWLLEGFPER
jgi:hypothetical protein